MRSVYIGAAKGMIFELFKFFGMLMATFIGLHYYSELAQLMQGSISIPVGLNDVLSLVLLWLAAIGVFKLIRDGWMLIIKKENPSKSQKWIGAALGFIRAFLVVGLLLFSMLLSMNERLNQGVRNSRSGKSLVNLSPRIYRMGHNLVVKRFFAEEKRNDAVSDLIKQYKENKKEQ